MTLFQILVAAIDRPAQAMAEVVARPRSWWLPAVLIIASLAALTIVSAPYSVELANTRQAELLERIAANLSPTEAEAVRSQMKPTTVSQLVVSGLLGGAATLALGWVVRAALVQLLILLTGGHGSWGGTFAAAGVWSMLPDVARNLLQTIWVLVNQRAIEYAGLSRLVASGNWLTDSRNLLFNLLARIDPFTVWHVFLLTFAIAACAHVSKRKGAILAVLTWAILLGAGLLPTLLSRAVLGSV